MSQLNENTRAHVGYMSEMLHDLDWTVYSRAGGRLAAYKTEAEACIFADGYNRRLSELAERDPEATRETAVGALCKLASAVHTAIPDINSTKKYAELNKVLRAAEKEVLRW
jgi:hypothetical protein